MAESMFRHPNGNTLTGFAAVRDRLTKPLFLAVWFCCALAFFGAPAPLHAEEQTLRFSSSVGMPFTNAGNSGFEDRLLKEIFRRLNRNVVVNFVPAERAMLNLDQGLDDGCLSRITGLAKTYPNIRQIPEVSLERDFVVFSKRAEIAVDDWKSLKPYHVAFITGWKILERNITEAKSITNVKNGEQLFRLLENDRVDVVVYNRWGGLQIVKELGLDSVPILEPPLVTVPHYFYLNKKHEQLVPRASRALQEMKRDGSYQEILDATLKPLSKKPNGSD